jgi:enoyl-CoA hydratase
MSVTSEFIDARRALEWGLVTEVVEHDALLGRAIELATLVAGNHAPAVRAIRDLYDEVAPLGSGDTAFELENKRAREWAARRAREIGKN